MFIHDQFSDRMSDFNPDFIWGYCRWNWPNYKDIKAQDDAFYLFLAA